MATATRRWEDAGVRAQMVLPGKGCQDRKDQCRKWARDGGCASEGAAGTSGRPGGTAADLPPNPGPYGRHWSMREWCPRCCGVCSSEWVPSEVPEAVETPEGTEEADSDDDMNDPDTAHTGTREQRKLEERREL